MANSPSAFAELRQQEVDYCRTDYNYFIDTYGHIEDKDNTEDIVQPFSRWKEQREATDSIMSHRLNVLLKARQLGFSWLACHIAAWFLLTPGQTIICLSKSEDEAKELIRRIAFILTYADELFADKKFLPINWDGIIFETTAFSILVHYPNGADSRVMGMASGPGAGRSFTANLIIIDEWAFQQFAREIWAAAYPTINRPTGGKVIGISTIERGTLFEELFTNPDNGFNKIFIPWYADPRRDAEWYEKTKRAMGDSIYAEYPATVEEALMVPGGSFFPEVTKDTHEVSELPTGNLKHVCTLDYGLDSLAAVFYVIDYDGKEVGYREVKEPNLTISQGAQLLLSVSAFEHIDYWLGPDDLWNRRQETGRSAADIFYDNGINLTKVNRDMFNGCMLLKNELQVKVGERPNMTFLKDTCPETIRCLQKIQKDKNKPTVYAKQPHDLTHLVDAIRYFATFWNTPSQKEKATQKKKWRPDLLADYRKASKEIKALMVKQLGEPIL